MNDKSIPISKLDEYGYNFRIAKGEVGTQINISKGDLLLLDSFREGKKKTLTTLVHVFLGHGMKCYLEKHDEQLAKMQFLEEQKRRADFIIALYNKKYGPLRVRRNIRDRIIPPENESPAGPH